MSRIGNRILTVPANLEVQVNNNNVVLKCNSNSLVVSYPANLIKVEYENQVLKVKMVENTSEANMFQGTVNANLNNAIIGLTSGFSKVLELKGVGYKAKVEGGKLNLALGYSHPINLDIPQNLKVETPSATEIRINGYDKQVVGQFASVVRSWRMPEPYKGKGVLYAGEIIVRKVGKTADKKK